MNLKESWTTERAKRSSSCVRQAGLSIILLVDLVVAFGSWAAESEGFGLLGYREELKRRGRRGVRIFGRHEAT